MSLGKRITSLLLVCACMLLPLTGCAHDAREGDTELTPAASPSDSNWEEMQENVVLENDRIRFTLDAATTHFTVCDKRTGRVYSSVPAEEIAFGAEEIAARSCSELTLHYYEEQSDVNYMYSTADSVAMDNYSIRSNGTAVRVYYRFGSMDTVLPLVLDEESFRTICEGIQSGAIRRRMERYYTLYSQEDKPEDFADKLSLYPILSDTPLYILGDGLTANEKNDISTYLSDAGYTNAQYEAMLKKLKIDLSETAEETAGFVVPVEYTLQDDGFSVAVLSDRIEEKSTAHKLQKIDLLEYFSATRETDGYYFVPDGSGALIDLGSGGELTSLSYYGSDYTENNGSLDRLEKSLSLPVFGASLPDGGMLAVIEQAAEVAQLNLTASSAADPVDHLYASFALRKIDVTDYGASMSIPIYNLFSAERIAASPRIRFILLPQGESTYEDMAAVYRAYLLENGTLTEQENAAVPVYLDYVCMITEQKSFLGIPYVQKTVLSTLSGIMRSVSALQEAGLDHIVVRLHGYGTAGYEHGAYTKYTLSKKVGSQQELEQLSRQLNESGGQLYLDADMQCAYRRGNGFSPSQDAARYLNRMVAYRGEHDIVTRKYSTRLQRYWISPLRFPEYTAAFRSSLTKALDGTAGLGLSYGGTGLQLGGDYAKTRDIDRTESVRYVETALSAAENDGFRMAFDNGNAYVLPYASHLLQVPDTDSALDDEARAVPFYQMVIHGAVSYAGTPYNMAADSVRTILNSAAMGAAPYGVFITESDSLLANTQYEALWYSMQDEARLARFIEMAQRLQTVENAVAGAAFTDYASVAPQVTCSTYANGVRVYVNYGEREVTVNGVTVQPWNFAVG